MKMTRGVRNNNPCNIRKGDKWQGMRKVQMDKAFVQFESMVMGLRAAFKTLKTYRDKHFCKTPISIIKRWAPPEDGDNTMGYIDAVEKKSGIDRFCVLGACDTRYISLVKAMCWVESLYVPSDEELKEAFDMVFR